ncbi:hypothetical protein XENOCAPTIV_015908 [Xenoophorus captivus]|uniref:Uncharacterized protein n=1 Tax=Xenoophorus captivus TaxID=1517983 RepID=A0ABV0S782_9TELE
MESRGGSFAINYFGRCFSGFHLLLGVSVWCTTGPDLHQGSPRKPGLLLNGTATLPSATPSPCSRPRLSIFSNMFLLAGSRPGPWLISTRAEEVWPIIPLISAPSLLVADGMMRHSRTPSCLDCVTRCRISWRPSICL